MNIDGTSPRFGKPPIGKRGYRPADVDAFLARVSAALENRGPAVTAREVHDVAFTKAPFRQRGYDEQQVDDHLDDLERRCRERFGA